MIPTDRGAQEARRLAEQSELRPSNIAEALFACSMAFAAVAVLVLALVGMALLVVLWTGQIDL